MQEQIEVASIIIGTVGSAGAIIFGLSNWLGKVWANRLMESEKQKYAQDLELLKAEISLKSQTEIERLKAEVEIFKTKELDAFKDRLTIYRQATDVISEALADLDLFRDNLIDIKGKQESLNRFNLARIKNRCHMSLICSPKVVQNFDVLIDEILDIYGGDKPYCWITLRDISNPLIDSLREELALSEGKIRYVNGD